MRPLAIVCLLALAALGAGCGSSSPQAAVGTPGHPLAATIPQAPFSEAQKASGPGYEELLAQQSATPRSRFTPCNLVTRAEAAAIIDQAVRPLAEAPQGPTCIYRSRQEQHGRQLVTVAVSSDPYATLRRRLKDRTPVSVGGRRGVCGTLGQPSLYVPVAGGRVLTITGHCAVARRFAAKAIPRLRG